MKLWLTWDIAWPCDFFDLRTLYDLGIWFFLRALLLFETLHDLETFFALEPLGPSLTFSYLWTFTDLGTSTDLGTFSDLWAFSNLGSFYHFETLSFYGTLSDLYDLMAFSEFGPCITLEQVIPFWPFDLIWPWNLVQL